jgi:AGCS family alanine or glycine:cation symporter
MDTIDAILSTLVGWVWGWPLVILLFGTHIFLTIRTGFIQKHIGHMIRLSGKKDSTATGDISHFGALMTALAATIGTGNIIGVATAITLGGPGAVLWMWLTGVLGIATKYGEALLSVKYRTTNSRGEMAGGPMYVIERALNLKWLAVLFAIFTAIAAFGIGNMIQSNAIATQLEQYLVPPEVVEAGGLNWARVTVGLVLAVLAGFTLIGGIRSIAGACDFLVPVMSVIYVIGCLLILITDIGNLPGAIATIFKGAFSSEAIGGGLAGVAIREVMRYGIARGLFSNEAGLGSAPIVAAAARTKDPVTQALVSASGTFWDTVVICLLTGLVFVTSGHWKAGFVKGTVAEVSGESIVLSLDSAEEIFEGQNFAVTRGNEKVGEIDLVSFENGPVTAAVIDGPLDVKPGDTVRGLLPSKFLANRAFEDLPVLGSLILTVGLATFVLSTILGWSYYGEKAVEYLFGTASIIPYRIIWVIAVFVGSLLKLGMVWNFADLANGLMAIPNLIALLILSGVIVAETKRYEKKLKSGDVSEE